MRIAQVSPLFESVPPRLYGGTERVVSYLTEELVERGHQVTLFAAGDSRTGAHLVTPCPRGLRLETGCRDWLAAHMVELEQVLTRAAEFDVIHFHTEPLHYPVARRLATPSVTTLHGRLDLPEAHLLYGEYRDAPVVSISNAQRAPVPDLSWQGTVHHGLPRDLLAPGRGAGGYLAFLGRLSPEKAPHLAIAIARRAGVPLRLAAKIDDADRAYFASHVEPLLGQPGIEFLGEIDESAKQQFLGDALALLSPIEWPEPFGLVVIEALACATPVIAFGRGSLPELVEHGVTGFVVAGVDEAVPAVAAARRLDRRACRRAFERRFTAARMAADYLTIYHRLTSTARPRRATG